MIVELMRLMIAWLVCGIFSYFGFNTPIPYGIGGLIPLGFGFIWSSKFIHMYYKLYKESKEQDKLLNNKKQNPILPKKGSQNNDKVNT